MSLSTSDIVVLDSNVLIHWARQDPTGQFLLATYALDQRIDRPLVPTTVEGEVRGLAKHRGWGKAKMEHKLKSATDKHGSTGIKSSRRIAANPRSSVAGNFPNHDFV